MSGTKSFGPIPDINCKRLCSRGKSVLDIHRNLTAENTRLASLKVRKDVLIEGNLVVHGDFAIQGNVFSTANGKVIINDTIVNGTMFSAQDEFNFSEHLSSPSANAWIELPSQFKQIGVMLVTNACTGNVLGINPISGNILYSPSPNLSVGRIDLLQYSALDEADVRHKITQFICQPGSTPPFVNNKGNAVSGSGAGPTTVPPFSLVFTDSILVGTNPIDWSTLVVSQITSYTTPNGDISPFPVETLPYGTNISPLLTGPGIQINPNQIELTGDGIYTGYTFNVTFQDLGNGICSIVYSANPNLVTIDFDIAVRFNLQVKDTFGLISNFGYYYFRRYDF